MPTAKPTVTDEHLNKYAEIMKTPVKSAASAAPLPAPNQKPKAASTMSQILAGLPKPKGIGNKMFIFTGKKKIIMDGAQREVEDIKTVDAKPEKNLPAGRQEKEVPKPEKLLTEKELMAKDVPTVIVEAKHEKEKAPEHKRQEAPHEAPKPKPAASHSAQAKNLPLPVLGGAVALFMIAYLFFWLVFFGYIKF